MAQNISLWGASYSAVPSILLPKTGGGTASFTDVTATTATASDVASGKIFFAADGTQTTGTNSGGDSVFLITITWNSNSELWEPDCTYSEAADAYDDGKRIVFVTNDLDSGVSDGIYDSYWHRFYYRVTWNDYDADDNVFTVEDEYTYTQGDALTLVDRIDYHCITNENKTVTPSESQQTITAQSGYTGLGTVTVNAIPSNYVGSGITSRSSSDLAASGATVTAPSGYYASQATKSVASGTAGTPTATKGAVSNHSVSVTPSVTNTTGYITGSTKTGTAVTVSASELVSGSETKTANGTYDVTNLAELVVNVSGGGGSEWTHIGSTELTVNTTSTSAASAGTISCGSTIADKDAIIYVRIRDKEGKRAGYFAGSDAYFMNYNKANGSTSAFAVPAVLCYRYTTSSAWAGTAGQYGVYGYSISNTGVLTVRRRYNSNNSLTINSTYTVDVFKLTYPTGYPAVFDM